MKKLTYSLLKRLVKEELDQKATETVIVPLDQKDIAHQAISKSDIDLNTSYQSANGQYHIFVVIGDLDKCVELLNSSGVDTIKQNF